MDKNELNEISTHTFKSILRILISDLNPCNQLTLCNILVTTETTRHNYNTNLTSYIRSNRQRELKHRVYDTRLDKSIQARGPIHIHNGFTTF